MRKIAILLFIAALLLVSYDLIVMHGTLGKDDLGGNDVITVKALTIVVAGVSLAIFHRRWKEEAEVIGQGVCLGIIIIYIYLILESVSAFP